MLPACSARRLSATVTLVATRATIMRCDGHTALTAHGTRRGIHPPPRVTRRHGIHPPNVTRPDMHTEHVNVIMQQHVQGNIDKAPS